jgi:hypothetical protein
MDDSSTKLLSKQEPPLPLNQVLPNEAEKDFEHFFGGGPESKVPDAIEIKET